MSPTHRASGRDAVKSLFTRSVNGIARRSRRVNPLLRLGSRPMSPRAASMLARVSRMLHVAVVHSHKQMTFGIATDPNQDTSREPYHSGYTAGSRTLIVARRRRAIENQHRNSMATSRFRFHSSQITSPSSSN